MTKKNASTGLAIGILSLFIIGMGVSYAQSLMAKLPLYYPDVDPGLLSYIMSAAFLGVLIGSLVAGVVSRVIGFKKSAIIGSALFCVFGVLPVWVHDSFLMMVVFRFFVGLGAGFMTPLANPLIAIFFEGDRQAKMLSLGSAISQIGAVAMQMLTGVLGDVSFWLAFLSPVVSVLSVAGALFLVKDPAPEDIPQDKGEKGSLPGRVWYCAILELVTCMALMPFLFNYSVFVAQVDDSLTLAAAIQVCYTVGMIVGGFVYMFMFKLFKRLTPGVSCVLCALGPVVFILGGNLPCFVIGNFLCGLGYGSLFPCLLQIVGFVVKPTMIAFATSICMVFMNLASFVTSPFISAIAAVTGDPVAAPIWVGVGIFVACAIVCFVKSPFPKDVSSLLSSADDEAVKAA